MAKAVIEQREEAGSVVLHLLRETDADYGVKSSLKIVTD